MSIPNALILASKGYSSIEPNRASYEMTYSRFGAGKV
jgi:hypothetical protein